VTASLNFQMSLTVRKGRLHSSDSQDKVLISASHLLSRDRSPNPLNVLQRPSKALLYMADALNGVRELERQGLRTGFLLTRRGFPFPFQCLSPRHFY
jgi:hypothetical protein